MSQFTFELNCLTEASDSEWLFTRQMMRYPDPMIPTLGVVLDFDMLKWDQKRRGWWTRIKTVTEYGGGQCRPAKSYGNCRRGSRQRL